MPITCLLNSQASSWARLLFHMGRASISQLKANIQAGENPLYLHKILWRRVKTPSHQTKLCGFHLWRQVSCRDQVIWGPFSPGISIVVMWDLPPDIPEAIFSTGEKCCDLECWKWGPSVSVHAEEHVKNYLVSSSTSVISALLIFSPYLLKFYL